MSGVYQLLEKEFQNGEWDNIPFNQLLLPCREENLFGTDVVHGKEENITDLTPSQGKSTQIPLHVQEEKPVQGPLQRREETLLSGPLREAWLTLLGNPGEENSAQCPSQIQKGTMQNTLLGQEGNRLPDPAHSGFYIQIRNPEEGNPVEVFWKPTPRPAYDAEKKPETENKLILRRKPKRTRTHFTTEQLEILEKAFSKTRILKAGDRIDLAKLTKLDEKVIKVWFQNRRMRAKNENSNILWPLNYPQHAKSTQDNHDYNTDEHSFRVPLPVQGLTEENVQRNNRLQNGTTLTYCENYVSNHLVGDDNEPITNHPAFTQETVFQRHSSNDLTITCHDMYVSPESPYTYITLANNSTSKIEAVTMSSLSTPASQERSTNNETITSFGETHEPRHYNIHVIVTNDTPSPRKIKFSESSNSLQSYSPRENSNMTNMCWVKSWNTRVFEEDYKDGTLFGVDPGIQPLVCHSPNGQFQHHCAWS